LHDPKYGHSYIQFKAKHVRFGKPEPAILAILLTNPLYISQHTISDAEINRLKKLLTEETVDKLADNIFSKYWVNDDAIYHQLRSELYKIMICDPLYQENPRFLTNAIRYSRDCLKVIPSQETCLKILDIWFEHEKDELRTRFMPLHIQDKNYWKLFLKYFPNPDVDYIPDRFRTKEMWEKTVIDRQMNQHVVHFMPEDFKTPEFMKKCHELKIKNPHITYSPGKMKHIAEEFWPCLDYKRMMSCDFV
jgi:hypothetical protein